METKNSKNKLRNAITITVFTLSAVVGFALLLISVWGDVEAFMFDLSQRGEKNLGTLVCPVIITPQDTGEFSVELENPLERDIMSAVRVHVSSGFVSLITEDNVKVDLAPKESKKLAWSVNPEDAAYGKMVLVKVFLFRNYPIPSKDATCGIFVINTPHFSGRQILFGGLGFSFIGMLAAIGMWQVNNRLMTGTQRELFRSMTILAGAITIGIVASLLGWWLLGGIGIVVTALLTIITLTHQF